MTEMIFNAAVRSAAALGNVIRFRTPHRGDPHCDFPPHSPYSKSHPRPGGSYGMHWAGGREFLKWAGW
jgi:hypothetical protein